MQIRKASSWVLPLLCALLAAATACDPEDKPGTAILLSVKSDIEELRSLQIKVLEGDGSKEDEDEEHTKQVSFEGVGNVTNVVVKPGKSEEVLIVVSGFDRSKNALAEVTFRAEFQQEKTLHVPVFLGNVCVNQFCGNDESCSGGPLQEARQCSSIRSLKKGEYAEIPDDERNPSGDWDDDDLVRTCMDGGVWSDGGCLTCPSGRRLLPDGACEVLDDENETENCDGGSNTNDGRCPAPMPDRGCDAGANGTCPATCDGGAAMPEGGCPCPEGRMRARDGGAECVPVCKSAVDGGICDLVSQCGCEPQGCQIDTITGSNAKLKCFVPVNPVLLNSECKTRAECPLGSDCVDQYCRQYCDPAVGCGASAKSRCDSIFYDGMRVQGINVCFPTCSTDADCPSQQFCNGAGICVRVLDPLQACARDRQCKGHESGQGFCVSETETTKYCSNYCTGSSGCSSGCCRLLTNGKYACFRAEACRAPSGCATGTVSLGTTCNADGECCGTNAVCDEQGSASVCTNLCNASNKATSCGPAASWCCAAYNGDAGVSTVGACASRVYATAENWTCL